MNEFEILDVGLQIASAVSYMHKNSIIHRYRAYFPPFSFIEILNLKISFILRMVKSDWVILVSQDTLVIPYLFLTFFDDF